MNDMDCLNNYRPNDFSLTKDHCTIDRSRNMEKKFRHAVVDWVNWACDKQGIDQKRTTQWIIYPDHYYKKVVFGSKHWPMHLPIGYVFVNYPSAAEPTEWASNFVEVCWLS